MCVCKLCVGSVSMHVMCVILASWWGIWCVCVCGVWAAGLGSWQKWAKFPHSAVWLGVWIFLYLILVDCGQKVMFGALFIHVGTHYHKTTGSLWGRRTDRKCQPQAPTAPRSGEGQTLALLGRNLKETLSSPKVGGVREPGPEATSERVLSHVCQPEDFTF